VDVNQAHATSGVVIKKINGHRKDVNLAGVALLGDGRGVLATFIHNLRAAAALKWLFLIPSMEIITH
jgi:hypothetical protein